ncbi:hypothetical protein N7471_013641 [Penicillium samsonianum]|uniref:uncharacterized protein n=1 Tax=Penicillium samsonianum TaxID=1882272 RepID=UPI002546D21B|nr:uncharacterized protein N7471_013641 [Penicillium samsonianum]KAJ6119021.1 hypothetical protein N7471_013641 [Penicillium samsonianum]
MSQANKPKNVEQQNTDGRLCIVEQYQQLWDHIYRDTCEQVDIIRGDTCHDTLLHTPMKD